MLAAVIAALTLLLGAIQIGSDAIFSRAAPPRSLPGHLAPSIGVAIYGVIDRVAPAPYVNAMLATQALNARRLQLAQAYAVRLPASPQREELLGRIAQARGDEAAAQRHFLAAPDLFAIDQRVDRLARTDPVAAYNLEMRLKQRLERLPTHPDAVAEAYWRLGQLATVRAARVPHERWLERGMRDYLQAVALSPLTEKYLLAAGSQALNLHNAHGARRFFRRAIDVDPASADAYAGLGIADFRLGDRAAAKRDAARSRAFDPNSGALATLDALLR